jgi:hypothetical protein
MNNLFELKYKSGTTLYIGINNTIASDVKYYKQLTSYVYDEIVLSALLLNLIVTPSENYHRVDKQVGIVFLRVDRKGIVFVDRSKHTFSS